LETIVAKDADPGDRVAISVPDNLAKVRSRETAHSRGETSASVSAAFTLLSVAA
jgi:hypothetical protein